MSGNASVSLVEALRGRRVALVEGRRRTTADALQRRTLGLAAWFIGRGVAPGDRVVMLLPPGADFAAALLALVWVGAVPVLLEPGQAPGAFLARVAACAPRFVVADPRLALLWRIPPFERLFRRRVPGLPPQPAAQVLTLPYRASGAARPTWRGPDDEALILFTSGTTGSPRAVVHTHGNLPSFLDNIGAVVDGLHVASYLAETPQQIFYALLLGSTCHVMQGQGEARVQAALRALAGDRVEAWFGSPHVWVRWLEQGLPPPPGLRTLLFGSAPVTRPFLRRLLERLPDHVTVRCVYGLTEAGPVCSVDAHEKAAWRGEGDLVGRPLPGVALRVVVDEVEVATPALAGRYLGEPPLGSWLSTGDLGALGAEGLVLRGRSKDMIIRRGVNLYPGVLEPLLADVLGEVALVGVYDRLTEDERVVLFHTGPFAEVRDLLGDAAPDYVLRLDALPRGGRQHKVDKAALRELARARLGIG